MDGSRARATILIVEDDDGVRFGVRSYLSARGHDIVEAATCAEAVQRLERPVDLVLLDFQLPDGDALQLMEKIRAARPRVPIIIVTAHGTIPLAVRAVRGGALDVITKPVSMARLDELVREHTGSSPRASAANESTLGPVFMGASPPMVRLRADLERLRDADSSVLILGETGAGKSVVARQLHALGARAKRRFVELNCAALTRDLVESELFGHERGSFTGAHAAKEGLFEHANGGTLFLDEIGDVDVAVQAKVLKVLEEKRFRRVGESKERTADVRILAATHRDLGARIRDGAFRADLYYRISTITLRIPPLRERVEDIEPLTRHLLAAMCEFARRPAPEIDPRAVSLLRAHPWPGNIRELKNVLERALLTRGSVLLPDDIRFDSFDAPSSPDVEIGPPSGRRTLTEIERDSIVEALSAELGRVELAAKRLGVPRSTLYQKIKAFGIEVSRIRSAARLER